MLGVDRQRQLLQHLRTEGSGDVLTLARKLGVSASTVRRDLKEMGERGLVVRVHGGASLVDAALPTGGARTPDGPEGPERRIAAAAAARVPDGATILVTGGTTTAALLPFLSDRTGLTVLTNNVGTAYLLARQPQITVVVLGGVLRHDELSMVGAVTELALADFHVDLALFSAFGVDPATGLSAASVSASGTDRRILQRARRRIALVASSSFGRHGPVRVADLDQLDCLVTDDAAPPEAVASLRARGVEVVLA